MILKDYYELVESLGNFSGDFEENVKSPEEILKEVEEQKEEAEVKANPRKEVREAIKPQVDIAKSLIESIKDAFADSCNNSPKYETMQKQIENWEKTVRGACEQIISIVESKGFMKKNEEGKFVAWDGTELNKEIGRASCRERVSVAV